MNLKNRTNEYVHLLGDIFDRTPKTVFAAIAVSYATSGGDYLEHVQRQILAEWWTLYDNGIVAQRPTLPRPRYRSEHP